jgi:hypothetical protein
MSEVEIEVDDVGGEPSLSPPTRYGADNVRTTIDGVASALMSRVAS